MVCSVLFCFFLAPGFKCHVGMIFTNDSLFAAPNVDNLFFSFFFWERDLPQWVNVLISSRNILLAVPRKLSAFQVSLDSHFLVLQERHISCNKRMNIISMPYHKMMMDCPPMKGKYVLCFCLTYSGTQLSSLLRHFRWKNRCKTEQNIFKTKWNEEFWSREANNLVRRHAEIKSLKLWV